MVLLIDQVSTYLLDLPVEPCLRVESTSMPVHRREHQPPTIDCLSHQPDVPGATPFPTFHQPELRRPPRRPARSSSLTRELFPDELVHDTESYFDVTPPPTNARRLTFYSALVTDAGPYSPSNETVIESLVDCSNYADASVRVECPGPFTHRI